MMKRSSSILPCKDSGMTTSTAASLLSIGPLLVNLLGTHFTMSSRASSLTSISALATGKLKNSGSTTTIAGCVPSDVKMMIMHPENENNTTGSLYQMKMKTPSTQRRTTGKGKERENSQAIIPDSEFEFSDTDDLYARPEPHKASVGPSNSKLDKAISWFLSHWLQSLS